MGSDKISIDHSLTKNPKDIIKPVSFSLTPHSHLSCFYCQLPTDSAQQQHLLEQQAWPLPKSLQTARRGRKTEFIAGRILAQSALEQCGLAPQWIAQNQDRSPAWPAHVQGSISHKKAMAIAVTSQRYRFLGIDLEQAMSESAAQKLQARIINKQEASLLNDSSLPFGLAFSIVFSAKEALYKGIYPWVQRYLPFSICEITAMESATLQLTLDSQISLQIGHSGVFQLNHYHYNEHIITLIAEN